MADNNTLARPYARAAFELARAEGGLDGWSSSLAIAGELLADGQVVDYLANPSLPDARRLEFLTGLMSSAGAGLFDGSNKEGTNFLKLLLEYDRIAVLPEVAAHFDALKAQVENTVEVTVTSAVPLGAAQLEVIKTALAARLGREVQLTTATDETLLGGAVIRAGDVVIDGSLRARLSALSHALIA